MKRIVEFGIMQTASFAAFLSFFISLLFETPIWLYMAYSKGDSFPLLLMIVKPFLNAIGFFVIVALFCWIYNIVAKRTGGIEFNLVDEPGDIGQLKL